jgi:hypothetical protein
MSIGILAIPGFCSLISPDTRTTTAKSAIALTELRMGIEKSGSVQRIGLTTTQRRKAVHFPSRLSNNLSRFPSLKRHCSFTFCFKPPNIPSEPRYGSGG